MNLDCKIKRCRNSSLCLTDLLFLVLPLFPLALTLFCLPVMDRKNWQLLPPALLFCMKAMLGLSKSPDFILFLFPVFSRIACTFLHAQRCGILCKVFCTTSLNCSTPANFPPIFTISSHISLVDHTQKMAAAYLSVTAAIVQAVLGGGVQSALINKDKQGLCCHVKMCNTKLDPRKQPIFFAKSLM